MAIYSPRSRFPLVQIHFNRIAQHTPYGLYRYFNKVKPPAERIAAGSNAPQAWTIRLGDPKRGQT